MIDTLLFDLDNTLLDFDKAEANAITRALGDVGISATNEMRDCYHKINLAQWKLLEQGKMTREEVKMRRFKLLFQEFDIKSITTGSGKTLSGLFRTGTLFYRRSRRSFTGIIKEISYLSCNEWNIVCTKRKIKKFRN